MVRFFAFDFEKEQMRKVVVKKEIFPIHPSAYTIHVNSLVSWSITENGHDDIDP